MEKSFFEKEREERKIIKWTICWQFYRQQLNRIAFNRTHQKYFRIIFDLFMPENIQLPYFQSHCNISLAINQSVENEK